MARGDQFVLRVSAIDDGTTQTFRNVGRAGERSFNIIEQGARRSSTAVDQFSRTGTRASQRFAGSLQNASFQLQDIIGQIAAGTDPIRTLSIQLPQLAGGFGAVGAAAGVGVGLLGAFATTLFGLSRDASEADKEADELAESYRELSERLISTTDDAAKLREELTQLSAAQRNLAEVGVGVERREAQSALERAREDAQAELAAIEDLLGRRAGELARGGELRAFAGTLGAPTAIEQQIFRTIDAFREQRATADETALALQRLIDRIEDPSDELRAFADEFTGSAAAVEELRLKLEALDQTQARLEAGLGTVAEQRARQFTLAGNDLRAFRAEERQAARERAQEQREALAQQRDERLAAIRPRLRGARADVDQEDQFPVPVLREQAAREAQPELEELRAQTDPEAARLERLTEVRQQLNEQVAFGNISQQEANRLLEQFQQRLDQTTSRQDELVRGGVLMSRTLQQGFAQAVTSARDLGDVLGSLADRLAQLAIVSATNPLFDLLERGISTGVSSGFGSTGTSGGFERVLALGTGFAQGGSFVVPGPASEQDNVQVRFLARSGEKVSIEPPPASPPASGVFAGGFAQGGSFTVGGGGGDVNVEIVDQRGADAPPIDVRQASVGGRRVVRALVRSEFSSALRDSFRTREIDEPMRSTFGVRRRGVQRG